MSKTFIRELLQATVVLAGALWAAHASAQPAAFADEDRDWGVAAARQLRTADYHAPTPRTIPGGKVVTTLELKAMLEKEPRPYLIDVLGGGVHRTLSGAFWMLAGGDGELSRDEEKRFLEAIAKFAGGDKGRPMVFFCVDSQCWLSYNAALRAIAAGYTNVMWYRGGIAAWRTAGLPMTQSDPFFWKE
ncbi:MAG: sulfurtransferase [Betaproteobacteria bacterium]|nr:sulfurtransferase [Betaproteobacteria bacterium]MBI2510110.1 sulfurtransferase [Betaproteobacteria bacterium]